MRMTTDGLIIKESPVGEDDRLVVVLTRERGLVRAFVKGARKLKNRNASSTGLLCYSNLTFYKNRDTYNIDEASPIEVFFSLRSDIEKLSLAQLFCEICLCLAVEETAAEDFLRLMLNSLYLLSKSKRPDLQIKSVFELRAMSISGYMPDLVACSGCGKYEAEQMFFCPTQAKLFCGDCQPKHQQLLPLSKGVLAAMRHIIYSDFSKLFQFELPEEGLRQLSYVTERYLLMQTEHRFVTLDFYNRLT